MSKVQSNVGASDDLWHVAPISMKDITWAGENPIGPGFAFGSEDGAIVFTDEAAFFRGCAAMVREGVNFRADHDVLTITFTGGY